MHDLLYIEPSCVQKAFLFLVSNRKKKKMEEYSNGKMEETQNQESQENGGGAVKELFQELKSEVHEVKEAVFGGDSEPAAKDSSSDEEEEVEKAELEEEEEKKKEEEFDSALDSVELVGSSDVTQEVGIPIEDGYSGDTNVVEQEFVENKEKIIELESEETVEKALPSVEETEVFSQVVENKVSEKAEETEVTALDETIGETSKVADKEACEEKIEDSVKAPAADVPAVDSESDKVDIIDITRTSPIISITSRTIEPTSWRSCCGLFEVLRRNR